MMNLFKGKILVIVIALIALVTCSKKGGTSTEQEENLVVIIEPDPGSTIARALGASYDLKVIVQSKMPAQGVEISITYRKDSDNSIIFSQTLSTNSSSTNVTINNIPLTDVGTVTVTVTSKSKPTNIASKTFKLARK
jgi:RNA polymerase subunit RPABC4/transcription elongation factor Spt4